MAADDELAKSIRDIWGNLRVPIRPGPECLDLYRGFIEKYARENILVLGATPELVDMAVELRSDKITSIERNPAIIEAMRQLGTRDWSGVEFIAGDWLDERAELVAAFDCVVCDGGLLFIEYPVQWQKLFALVYSYLRPGGIFVVKEWAEPPGDRNYERLKEDLIAEFEEESKSLDYAARIDRFKYCTSELRTVTMMNTGATPGSFNQAAMVDRLDALIDELEQRFPDPGMVQLTLGAMKYLARSQPGRTDIISGMQYDKAALLLAEQGFEADYFSLPDRPVPGTNYMFAAHKK